MNRKSKKAAEPEVKRNEIIEALVALEQEKGISKDYMLERIGQANREKAEARKRENDQRRTGLTCLRCDGQMLDHGPVTFKLGEETFFFGDWNRLISGAVTMNILRCEKCGKVEFFAPDGACFDDISEK